jgi:hypothetical protein
MCENKDCTCNELEKTTLTEEQLKQLENALDGACEEPSDEYMFEPIAMEIEDYDTVEFDRGVSDFSYWAGAITALKNTGLRFEDVVNLILNKMTIDHNIVTGKMANETSIEVSKNQTIVMDKNTL